MNKHLMFEKENLSKLIFKYTVPAMVAMVASALNNILDRIFVGQAVGMDALSGVALTFPITVTFFAFTVMFAVGTSVKVSLKLGEKKVEEAEKIIGNGVCLSIIAGISLTLILLPTIKPILIMLGGAGAALGYAEEYMQIIIYMTVFQITGYTLNHSIRASGEPVIALITILGSAVTNIILNAVFIFGFKLGVKGSALGTLISQVFIVIWTFSNYKKPGSTLKLRLRNFNLIKENVKGIVTIGLPALFLQGLVSITLGAANIAFSKYGGNDGLALIAIIGVIYTMFHMTIAGINQGIGPIIGYNYGAKNYSRVKHTLKISIIMGTVISIIGFLAVFFFSRNIIMLFSKDSEFIAGIGAEGLKYTFLTLPLFGYAMISAGYFSAVGKYKIGVVVNLVRVSLLTIPLLMILPKFFGFIGCFAAFPSADIIASLVITILLLSELKKLNKLKEDSVNKNLPNQLCERLEEG